MWDGVAEAFVSVGDPLEKAMTHAEPCQNRGRTPLAVGFMSLFSPTAAPLANEENCYDACPSLPMASPLRRCPVHHHSVSGLDLNEVGIQGDEAHRVHLEIGRERATALSYQYVVASRRNCSGGSALR